MLNYTWLILLFPLAGTVFNGVLGRWLWPKRPRFAALVGSLAVGASFVVAMLVFVALLGLPAETAAGDNGRERIIPLFSWIVAGDLQVEAALLLDQLSIVMTLVVTGVSTLIHIYSAAYMAGEEYYHRYFTWLNLFVFMMLVLVLGNSFLTLYLGWEGVGLCSYLLIGYWFEKESAANAGKKAFIVNRVGDFGFALGILLIFATFGSIAFGDVFPAASTILPGTATAIALLLFLGATAKSAQIPLYVWLPDAMEGPTPVSALIHAATMVTAGVYMVARCHPIFEQSLSALNWVAWIGALTALLAATMALVQTDFKRILAYSTISQLGYMFLGLGVGAYAAGIFHLVTHAFFKALLFLCAGSVLHAFSGEQDIFRMGGLRRKMPWTFATFLVGALALAGVPLLSGFFSKDEILFNAFQRGSFFLWLIGLFTAGLTAFYIFRLLFVVFYGQPRLPAAKKAAAHVHEAPWTMVIPLVILAVLAALGGYVGLPHAWGLGNAIDGFLHPVLAAPPGSAVGAQQAAAPTAVVEWALMALSVVAAGTGIYLAYWLYVRHWGTAAQWTKNAGWLHDLLAHKYYVDEAYDQVIVQPLRSLAAFLGDKVEVRGIDAAVNGLGRLVGLAGEGLSRLQSGLVRAYALAILAGAAALVIFLVVRALALF